jgi:hypothetical protein
LAANRSCSASCASRRASIESKESASSRNSSCAPSSSIRWESDPLAARRVAVVIRVRGASIRPASTQPPSRPKTSRNSSDHVAGGTNARRRSLRPGKKKPSDDRVASVGT